MRVIMFQPRFALAVACGAKRQTIRPRAGCAAGDELSLRRWAGKPYRSKQVEIMRATCTGVQQVFIDADIGCWPRSWIFINIDGGEELSARQAERFARDDGFASRAEMREWFDRVHGLPFCGDLIRWAEKAGGAR